MRYVFEPYFIMFQTKISDVSFPTSLNSFSQEINEQPIPVTGSSLTLYQSQMARIQFQSGQNHF